MMPYLTNCPKSLLGNTMSIISFMINGGGIMSKDEINTRIDADTKSSLLFLKYLPRYLRLLTIISIWLPHVLIKCFPRSILLMTFAVEYGVSLRIHALVFISSKEYCESIPFDIFVYLLAFRIMIITRVCIH